MEHISIHTIYSIILYVVHAFCIYFEVYIFVNTGTSKGTTNMEYTIMSSLEQSPDCGGRGYFEWLSLPFVYLVVLFKAFRNTNHA